MKKILVTGSTSFIGNVFIELAINAGHTIYGLDQTGPEKPPYTFIKADIREHQLAQILPPDLDAVVHLAAISRDQDCQKNLLNCFDVNVTGSLNLLQAINPHCQFIFASSEWVYDSCTLDHIKTEQSAINAMNLKSPYALSKYCTEVALYQQFSHSNRNTTVLRFGIVYGPRANNWAAVESLFHAVATQATVEVGSLQTARCFVHVRDIARGILAALDLPGFEIINLAAPRLFKLKEIIETSQTILQRFPPIQETNPTGFNVRYISNEKANQMLGWQPQIDLMEGLTTLKSIL